MTKGVTIDLEVRHISEEVLEELKRKTDHPDNHYFKMLARTVPMELEDYNNLDKEYVKKYTEEDIETIINAKNCKDPFSQLMYEWGTSSTLKHERPRLAHLIVLFEKIEHYRASHYLRELANVRVESKNDIITMATTIVPTNVPNLSLFQDEGTVQPISTYTEHLRRLDEIDVPKYEYDLLLKKTKGFSTILGKGGFGEVFLAFDLSEEISHAAVKKSFKFDARLLKKFVDELKVISTLSHTNIIKLIGYSVKPDTQPILCLVYEYANNGTLRNKLTRARTNDPPYSFIDRVKHLQEVSKALSYLHIEKTLIHRDVKPENILLDENSVKLCDFGLVRHIDSSTQTKPVGTSGYFAPELLNGDISVKVDIFSFGMVLLECVTGMKVFDNDRNKPLGEFVRKCSNKLELLPSYGGGFDEICLELIDLALDCINVDKTLRPEINVIEVKLDEICDNIHLPALF